MDDRTNVSLGHIFWLGGSPCAGKTSIGRILAKRFDLNVYHVDEAFDTHARSFDSLLQPALTKWSECSWEQRWMQPIDSLIQDAIACYREHFTLILKDVLSLPEHTPLLVEGTALLPRQVADLLPRRRRAIWIIPTGDFQREHYAKREWAREISEQCGNSEAAFQNWMERDAGFARWVRAEVNALGLELLEVDGKFSIEQNARLVANYFQLGADVA